MKNRVLFVTEKWYGGHPNGGLTNNFHNLFATFEQCKPEYKFNTLHLDECALVYGQDINEVLPKYCLQNDINLVFFCLLGDSPLNPKYETYGMLKSLGVKLCFVWPDTGPGWAINNMYDLQEFADLQVSWDRAVSDYHSKLPPLKNHLPLWAPQDVKIFHEPAWSWKTYPVAFWGSSFPQRQKRLDYLKTNIPEFIHEGGQSNGKLNATEYGLKLSLTKIVVNFPEHALGFTQLKSRVLETLSTGGILVEFNNPSTSQLFKPNVDYVSVADEKEAVEKIRWLLDNEIEGRQYAMRGHDTYHRNYTAQHYWDKVFENITL